MALVKIDLDLEVSEVLNQFPFLKVGLKNFGINFENLQENISIREFLKEKGFSNSDRNLILRKINFLIDYYFKHNNLPKKEQEIKIGNYNFEEE